MRLHGLPALGCLAWLLATGCSSTTQIQTARPRPAVAAAPDTTEAALARLAVTVETGAVGWPAEVKAMRFRVAELHLKPAGGAWTAYPADANLFEVTAGKRARKTVLSTQVPPARYDSLALALGDVFVLYDANAGGPLTMPRETPLRLPLAASLEVGRPTTLRLVFEPGASLSRDADCRWFFLPFVELHRE